MMKSKNKLHKSEDLNKELSSCLGTFISSTVLLKRQIIRNSINCYIDKQMKKKKQQQKKKTDPLIVRKSNKDSSQNKRNNLISNLTGKALSDTKKRSIKAWFKTRYCHKSI